MSGGASLAGGSVRLWAGTLISRTRSSNPPGVQTNSSFGQLSGAIVKVQGVAGKDSAAEPPEDRELRDKERELSALEDEFAGLRERIATLTSLLARFEARYQGEVGVLFSELDGIEARLARQAYEASTREEHADAWREADERARESAQASGEAPPPADAWGPPTPEGKALFREAAKRLHPDLHEDPRTRQRATLAMAAANEAYGLGDLDELRRILREWEQSPEAVAGDDTAALLVRAIRRIAQVRERIAEARVELEALQASELNQLRERAEADPELLGRLRADLEAGLGAAQQRLSKTGARR